MHCDALCFYLTLHSMNKIINMRIEFMYDYYFAHNLLRLHITIQRGIAYQPKPSTAVAVFLATLACSRHSNDAAAMQPPPLPSLPLYPRHPSPLPAAAAATAAVARLVPSPADCQLIDFAFAPPLFTEQPMADGGPAYGRLPGFS